jgi:hypothetical protein
MPSLALSGESKRNALKRPASCSIFSVMQDIAALTNYIPEPRNHPSARKITVIRGTNVEDIDIRALVHVLLDTTLPVRRPIIANNSLIRCVVIVVFSEFSASLRDAI